MKAASRPHILFSVEVLIGESDVLLLLPVRAERAAPKPSWLTFGLVGVNCLVTLVLVALPKAKLASVCSALGFSPAGHTVVSFRLLTSIFLHAGLLHLAINMFVLCVFGPAVEDALGKARYAAVYLLGGVAGGLVHKAAYWSDPTPVVGASGAVCGLLGVYFSLFPHNKVTVFVMFVYYIRLFKLEALWVISGWLVIQTVYAILAGSELVGVAYEAHIGGFAAGFLLAWLLKERLVVDASLLKKESDEAAIESLGGGKSKDKGGTEILARRAIDAMAAPELEIDWEEEKSETTPEFIRGRAEEMAMLRNDQAAAELWLRLREKEPDAVLSEKAQLVVARWLMQARQVDEAMAAFEAYLAEYPDGPEAQRVALRLGLLYQRRFRETGVAEKWLRVAADGGNRAVAESAKAALERLERMHRPLVLSRPAAGAKYAVVAASVGRIAPARVSRLIVEVTGAAMQDVMRRLRVCPGIFAADLDWERAKTLAQRMSERRIGTVVVANHDVPPPPPAEEAAAAVFTTEGLFWREGAGKDAGEEEFADWERILVLNGGVLESGERAHTADAGREAYGGLHTRPEVTVVRRFGVIDVVMRKPHRRLRLRESSLSYDLMHAHGIVGSRNFRRLAQQAVDFAPDNVLVSEPVHVLAGKIRMPPERITLDAEKVLDLEDLWYTILVWARTLSEGGE